MENSGKEPLRFLIVGFIYLAAIALAVLLVYLLPLSLPLSFLIADIAATVLVFLFSLMLSNASVYDPYWSVQPIVIVVALSIMKRQQLQLPAILLLVAVLVWGVRLTANWAYTFKGLNEKFQDWRYTALAEHTGRHYFLVNLIGIHLIPTLIVYTCTLPVIYVFENLPAFNVGFAIFMGLSLLAVLLEGIADCTLHKFKKDGGTGFLRKGVWKYSRHPNYLGEILFWWCIAIAVIFLLPHYWWFFVGALANTVLFLYVSIPMADGHQARKEGFPLYKKNTRMLLPIYKKQQEQD